MSSHRTDTIVFCGLIALHGSAGWLMPWSSASQVARSASFGIRLLHLLHMFSFLVRPLSVSLVVQFGSRYLHKIPRFPDSPFRFQCYCVTLLAYWVLEGHTLCSDQRSGGSNTPGLHRRFFLQPSLNINTTHFALQHTIVALTAAFIPSIYEIKAYSNAQLSARPREHNLEQVSHSAPQTCNSGHRSRAERTSCRLTRACLGCRSGCT